MGKQLEAVMKGVKMKRDRRSHIKGRRLEADVLERLSKLRTEFPSRISLREQPRIELQSGEPPLVPDFDLVVRLPFAVLHYLIECQDRARNSKEILYKIHYMRNKQLRSTFMFVYRTSVSVRTLEALRDEGIMVVSLEELGIFVEGLLSTLNRLGFEATENLPEALFQPKSGK